jgi:hypothetical protein
MKAGQAMAHRKITQIEKCIPLYKNNFGTGLGYGAWGLGRRFPSIANTKTLFGPFNECL